MFFGMSRPRRWAREFLWRRQFTKPRPGVRFTRGVRTSGRAQKTGVRYVTARISEGQSKPVMTSVWLGQKAYAECYMDITASAALI